MGRHGTCHKCFGKAIIKKKKCCERRICKECAIKYKDDVVDCSFCGRTDLIQSKGEK